MTQNLPDWREKKEILWGTRTSAEEQIATGDAFLRAGRLPEAMDAFERVKHADGMRAVLREAVVRGDWYLFKRVREALGEELRSELASLADKAFEKGRYLYALRAARALGDEALAARALEKVKETYPSAPNILQKIEEEVAPALKPPEAQQKPEPGKKTPQ